MSLSILNKVCNKVFSFTGPADAETLDREVKFPIAEKQTIASAATVNCAPVYKETYIEQAVAAAMTYNIAATNAKFGDKVYIKFAMDGTDRTVTWGTGVSPMTATLGGASSANKKFFSSLYFDGTNWQEYHRTVSF